MTNPACTTRTIGCAPIVHFEKKQARTVSVPLALDALGLVPRTTSVKDLMEVLKGAAARQAGDMAACILAEFKRTGAVSQPQVHQFSSYCGLFFCANLITGTVTVLMM
jgi:hypothetical protein